MRPLLNVTVLLLFIGVLSVVTGLLGCVPANNKANTTPPPNIDFAFEVPTIKRFRQLGRYPADGVYLLPHMAITNQTANDKLMQLKEWQLQYRPPVAAAKGKPAKNMTLLERPIAYQQAPETNANVLIQTYSQTLRSRFKSSPTETIPQAFKQPEDVMHPQLPAHRLLVFQVPEQADLTHYTLQWKPNFKPGLPVAGGAGLADASLQPITLPLVGATTLVAEVEESPLLVDEIKKHVSKALSSLFGQH